MILRGLLALACAGVVGMATAAAPAGPQIVTDDVSRFYYLQAKNKRDAVRALIQQDNPKAILAASDWTPGMWMPAKVTGVAARTAAR